MRVFYFAGYALGMGVNLLARPLIAHARLRSLVADLELQVTTLDAENAALAAICDDMARKAARAQLADLDATETYDDFTYLTGIDDD